MTVIQLVHPLHECADHAPVEFAAKLLHSVADFAAAEEATTNPAAVELLHSTADPVGSGTALTEIFCLCF
jgi:hypothetical protein